MLKKVSPENLEKEKNIQKSINNGIDKNENIVFNSGAGSGKTYALIESLKHIINKYEHSLKQNNQKIICITYTNVATNEVKERLGNTELVKVSTIHERIWDLIKAYQRELVEIHKDKLVEEIINLETDLIENDKFAKYNSLSANGKEGFKEIMFENKDLFYKNYSEKSAPFKTVFESKVSQFSTLLSNVAHFKKLVVNIFKLENFKTCLENISSNKKGYNSIKYNSTYNRDVLHRMQISHDTLLDYGLTIIEQFNLLKQIIIDKYPYILIDEYQDTNEKVVKIIKLLSDYAEKIKHNLFVGYFGDPVQNIYDDGVGENLNELHPDLSIQTKSFNRRSAKEIIDVINNIRKDGIEQISVYDDCSGGNVKFYTGFKEDITDFINKYSDQWKISNDNKLHCFLLTNKSVAEFSGFKKLYESLKITKYYKQYYDQLNTEFLNYDLSKLGEIPILLFRILEFRNFIEDDCTPIQNIINEDIYKQLKLVELKKLIELIQSAKGNNLGDFLKSISEIYKINENSNFKLVIDNLMTISEYNYENFRDYFLELLYPNLKDEEIEIAKTNIDDLLNVDFEEYNRWYNFILRNQRSKIEYHTYHGTKGLEFDNVIVIMENAFGRDKNYFNLFFENFGNYSNLVSDKDKIKFIKVRNLLYVSCSRAIKNLRILYLDDISKFSSSIESIFGEIYKFDSANTQLHSLRRGSCHPL